MSNMPRDPDSATLESERGCLPIDSPSDIMAAGGASRTKARAADVLRTA